MEKKKLNELLKIAMVNHDFLINRLSSREGVNLLGRWVAVAKKKLFVDTSFRRALNKAKKVEPARDKILMAHIPDRDSGSLRF